MFSIIIDQVTNECSKLESQVYDMRSQMEELESVRSAIKGLSGMDSVIRRLDEQLLNLDEEYNQYSQMLQALNKIVLCYTRYEKRIADNGEQSIIVYHRKEVGTNDLSGILSILNGIHAR
jgi:hypothetical protein